MFVASNEFVVAGLLLLLSLAVADSEDVAVDGVVVAGIVAVAAVILGLIKIERGFPTRPWKGGMMVIL